MANISRQALTKVVKQNLRSNLQSKVVSIMKEVGVNPAHSASLKGYEAKKVMMKLKEKGLLKPGATHLTAGQFETQFKKADAPTGPSAAVVKAGKMVAMRQRMDEEAKKKAEITAALAKKPGAPGAPKPSASRAQAPAVGGGAIGKAAQDASRSGSGALGSFSGADRIERGSPAERGGGSSAPSKEEGPEAIDPFGED
ncbi:hypothetical protein EPO33_03695 [Patescibacteria group bacterium]|nr:MAG: hypothetical protein EPO33_03695 [Patescibacteria group bacterium]